MNAVRRTVITFFLRKQKLIQKELVPVVLMEETIPASDFA